MVVMDGVAGDVRVVAARQVDPLDRSQLGQDVERPEDGGASDAEATVVCVVDEVGRREMAVPARDQVHDRTAGGRRSIAGATEGRVDRGAGHVHGRDDTQSQ